MEPEAHVDEGRLYGLLMIRKELVGHPQLTNIRQYVDDQLRKIDAEMGPEPVEPPAPTSEVVDEKAPPPDVTVVNLKQPEPTDGA